MTNALNEFFREVNSGYGNPDSSVNPCKEILTIDFRGLTGGPSEQLNAAFIVTSFNQSPWGDTATLQHGFALSPEEVSEGIRMLESGEVEMKSELDRELTLRKFRRAQNSFTPR